MSRKTNKLINQESREDYGDEAAEVATLLSLGDEKFDGAEEKFEEVCAE